MNASQILSRVMRSRYLYFGVAAASALESTVVPVPFEILLIPVMQGHRSRIFYFSLMALLGCVLGALLGYLFGYALYETLGAVDGFHHRNDGAVPTCGSDDPGRKWFLIPLLVYFVDKYPI